MAKKEEPPEYVVFPEEAIQYLPEEWQEHILALKEEGQGVLEAADKNLKMLNRLVQAFPTMASLRYIHHRLSSTKFAATTEWALENDMLTLAFVTTYARLIGGGHGSGVARSALPAELRPVHDKIIELRNKRYAHNAGHDSITGILEIGFEDGKFDIGVKFNMGVHVGGALEWKPLVEFLDGLMFERLHAQLEKLREKTGREWIFPSGPPPEWVSSAPDTQEESLKEDSAREA
ncbi:hypothetical protein EN851_20255 [Mesorhizobium sp. M8A.F.Ca.ET.208.01.1.1]|uniref:hypothetical protein n=1 Tax=unclassified Mesorhizobium TaxID=325217 RepID=UPI0010938C9B|nr:MULTISPECIES: hypothetical protein [unclassified Mesorhizobium]TGQ89971.1 hypothetical protein EN851_20255 [Mesorhizobium sp. M8A.F.Ca.ET.208.01.1.1]TGT50810.1 hypothetical protein EN810_20155 [Mesorhizobium sp. M8A.F.Ca.ET.167.01.1.1]